VNDANRPRIWPAATVVLIAGALLALAWWDWLYPGQLTAWARGERTYRLTLRRLGWMVPAVQALCLVLWGASARATSDRRRDFVRSARVFLLAFLVTPLFARYVFHPLGIQHGSSVWTYGLAAVTALVLALPLARIFGVSKASERLHRRGWVIVGALAGLYALVFGLLGIARHVSFQTHALDLGTMDQAAWNTVQGRLLERTPLYRNPAEGSRYENRLLDAKLELLFIPLSYLYALWPDPRVLLILQTLCLAGGAIPLYGFLRDRAAVPGQKPFPLPALVLAAAYLLYLPLHYVNMADFHPSALMIPFLIAAWWAMTCRRWRGYYLWLVLALCCRIDAAFATLAIGAVIAASTPGNRKHGLYTLGLAMLWLAADWLVVVPAVRQIYGPGAGDLVSRRFGILGSSPVEVLRAFMTQPSAILTRLVSRETLQTAFDLFAPLGFLSLLHWPALLPGLPLLVINLLAESAWQNSVHAHYMAPVIPFIWIAAGGALAWLVQRGRHRWMLPAALFVLLNTLLVAVLMSPFPPGKAFHLADHYQPSVHEENLRTVIGLVPDGVSVCAQSDLHPHLSQRRDACLFPRCQLDESQAADYVLVDLDDTSDKSPLGYHAFYEIVDLWLEREDYGVVSLEGGTLLLQRGAPRDNLPKIHAALDQYGHAFYRVDFAGARLPGHMRAAELYQVPVTLRNEGSQIWDSLGQLPVRLSYRWWTSDGAQGTEEALRTNLPHRIAPGYAIQVRAWLLAPAQPGEYRLEWDLVREGDAWFKDRGAETLRQMVVVK